MSLMVECKEHEKRTIRSLLKLLEKSLPFKNLCIINFCILDYCITVRTIQTNKIHFLQKLIDFIDTASYNGKHIFHPDIIYLHSGKWHFFGTILSCWFHAFYFFLLRISIIYLCFIKMQLLFEHQKSTFFQWRDFIDSHKLFFDQKYIW